MINEPVNQRHMSDNPSASARMTTQSRPPGLAEEAAERTSLGHRFQRALPGGANPRFPGLHPSPGGAASLSPLSNKRLILPFLAFVAVLAAGLLFLMPGGLLQAQSAEQFFDYPENGDGPVATFTASDPEGAMPIVWSVAADDFTDTAADIAETDSADGSDFRISSDGVLSFRSSPNYEMPRGDDLSVTNTNTYRLVVQASDGDMVDRFKVIVTVTNVDEPGKVTWTVDPDGTGGIDPILGGLLQFRTGARLDANVTDPDSDALTVTSWKWYRSSSMSATGTQISGATTDTYDVSDAPSNNDVGSYIRVEATYRDSATGSSKTVSFTSENPVLGARGNQPPTFVSTAVSRRIAENAAVGDPVGGPITAMDADGDTLTYSIPAATPNFAINAATGQLTVKAGAMLNHDADNGDSQDVVVTVNDPSGSTTLVTTTVTINITDVNEAPAFAAAVLTDDPPTNPSVAVIAENATGDDDLRVGSYSATDPDDDTPSLSLMGPDAGMFQHVASTSDTDATDDTVIRIVSFKASPDYDMPGDSNGDNVYEVTVRASDGANYKDMQVVVKVTDLDEDGKITLSSQDAQIGVELTATLSDDDGGVPNAAQFTDQKWTWHRLASDENDNTNVAAANAIAGATSSAYTPVSADSGMILAARVSYTDRYGMKTWTSAITRAVRAASANQAPKFSEGASTFRIVMENAAADVNVGSVVLATDVNGDALAYTLSGADAARFKVIRIAEDVISTANVNEAGQPQIQVKSGTKLDYETRNRYTVTLTANDGSDTSNATASLTVTIYVTDVDEKPTTSGPQTVNYAENRTNRVATFTARDPERVTPISWSLAADTFMLDVNGDGDLTDPGDVAEDDSADGSDFKISSDGMLSFRSSPNYEMPRNQALTADNMNTYRLVVQASDGNNSDAYKVLVTVTDINEPGKVTWTVGPGGNPLSPVRSLLQFRSGAQLVATVTDGDGVVDADTTWKWFRGSTQISGEIINTYIVDDDDVNNRIRVEASYRESADRPIKKVSFTSQYPVLATRTATNNDPEFVSATLSRGIAENASAGDSVGGPITASDADGDRLTYSIPADTTNFAINAATGRLTVKAGAMLNHDTTPSQDVAVTVTDPSGGNDSTTVTINITDVNEAPAFAAADANTTPPTNPSVEAIVENATGEGLRVGSYSATDPDDDTASLSLMGPDAGMFQLADDSANQAEIVTRIVSFQASPNYDMPGDSNGDNVYEVTVRASDGANYKDMQVVVKVTDLDEDGKITLSSQDAQIGVELTATLSDDDGGVPNAAQFTDQKWTWHRLASDENDNTNVAAANAIAGATSSAYTPVSADSGMILAARVSYTDRYGMKTWTSAITRAVRTASDNQAPKFSEGASTFRIIMENAQPNTNDNPDQGNVGGPITAMDVNGDVLAYTLGGADAALFKVDPVADDSTTDDINENLMPQIEVKSGTKLDYETRNRYTVTLTANDGSGTSNATAMITVTIYVTDMDEKPELMVGGLAISGPPSKGYMENIMDAVGTYTAVGPMADMARWTLGGADAMYFSVDTARGAMTELMFRSAPDYEMPRGRAMSDTNTNTYMVTLKANDGRYMDTHDVMVMVTNEDDPGRVTLWAGADALTMAPEVGDTITGAVVDPDGGVTGETWQWSKTMTPDMMDSWMDITDATEAAYIVMEGDDGYYLRVKATYTDAVGTDMAMRYSPATMMVGAEAEDPLLAEYDGDKDGSIQLKEARAAVGDYFVEPKGTVLSLEDARKVVGLYFVYKNSQ